MDPNQPNSQPQPLPDYNFILSSTPPKRGLSNLNPKKRLIVVGVLFTAVLLSVVLFFNLVRGSNNGDVIVDLLAYQTELVRISERGVTDGSVQVKNTAQTAVLSIQTELLTTQEIAKRQGIKYNEKQLASYQSAKTNATLDEAKRANRFDDVFIAEYETALTTYQQKLRVAINEQNSKSARQTFATFISNAELLKFSYKPIGQAKQTQ